MAVAQEPDIEPFTYCFLPADRTQAITDIQFTGKTDKELRDSVGAYFGQEILTEGQRREFVQGLKQQVEDNQKKAIVPGKEPGGDVAMADDGAKDSIANMAMAHAMGSQGGFEIVPVIYPDALNGFKGLSLYIDQVGRFKDLPLNERASKIAQRDIRGDAFVIGSYDDPIKDTWARVSTCKEDIDSLVKNPPRKSEDATARAAAMQASLQTKVVSAENVSKAKSLKDTGNSLFVAGNHDEAIVRYTSGIDELTGRKDDVDAKEVAQLEAVLRLNRAQTHLKMRSWAAAEADCTAALLLDPTLIKGWYRRANARICMRDFDGAQGDLQRASMLNAADPSIAKLTEQLETERAKHEKAQRAKFSKMFSS
ncbi:Serine/threonine-protein phosphatase 5 [Diplonema papillatum]|nr:Serine/threonine-protein phosphatase 5 [Diplonema papillatum]